jgi:hypothetical protein
MENPSDAGRRRNRTVLLEKIRSGLSRSRCVGSEQVLPGHNVEPFSEPRSDQGTTTEPTQVGSLLIILQPFTYWGSESTYRSPMMRGVPRSPARGWGVRRGRGAAFSLAHCFSSADAPASVRDVSDRLRC